MKPEDVVIGQRYAIIDNTGDESLERFLCGTNRVVKVLSQDSNNIFLFYLEHYDNPVHDCWIKCWVPGVGELAEFSDGGNKWSGPHAFDGYLPNGIYSFRITGGVGFKYARPVQKKAEPDRKAIDDDWRGQINSKLEDLTRRLDAVEAKDIRAVAHDELLAILFKNWNKTAMPVNPFYARTTDDKGL